MLSKSLMKKTIKDNWKFWATITAVLILFLTMFFAMANSFGDRIGDGPGSVGVSGIITQYYSMFAIMLPMIYIVITGNKLIAAQVDKGSFGYVMANPVKRNQVSGTQAVFLIGSVVSMFALITLTGIILIAALGLEIAIGSFLLLNLGAVLLLLAISGISYLASCIFNRSSSSLAIGAGIPIAFFLFSMFSQFEGQMDFMKVFKYLTINSLFNISNIMDGSANIIWQFLILAGITAACYVGGVLQFKKKDLPL